MRTPTTPCTALTEVGSALTAVAERFGVPFAGDARSVVRRGEIRRHAIWRNPPVDTGGLPVVLVGGLLTASPVLLSILRTWLDRLGCRTILAPTGFGVSCGEESTQILTATLREVVATTGEAPVVVAYSRGGQFARAAAVRDPDLVRGLVTLGSPLRDGLADIHPLLRLQVYALGTIGTLGVPHLLRATCLWGGCCRQLRADVTGPFPADVPFLSVYSRADDMVGWQASLDPGARHHEVHTTHGGLVADPAVFTAIAAELAAVLGSAEPDDAAAA